MNALDFLQTIYRGASSGWLTVWTMPDKKTAYFPAEDFPAAAEYSESLASTHDVYYGVGLRREKLGDHQRGGNGDVSIVPALWSDIDVLGPAHKETALPENIAAALTFLNSLPLAPTMVVSSGNGLHVYWVFNEPLTIATEAHRSNIAGALRGWQAYINDAAQTHGWKLDNTSDLSRVLRLPGSVNHKKGGNGGRVTVIAEGGARYAPSAFTPYIQKEPALEAPEQGRTEFSGTLGSGERIIEKCAFIRHCRDNAASLPEPHWYAMLGNLALCPDGPALCHQFSKPYAGYKAAETDEKIAHAIQASKPHTCAYIREALGFDCAGCDAGCKAPVALAVITRAETTRVLLEADIGDYACVFSDDYIVALHYAKAHLPADYAKFKMRVKGRISLVDLEKCIKAHGEITRKAAEAEKVLTLEGIDLRGAVVPRKWQITEEGGVRRVYSSREAEGEVIACPDPVVITRRLVNIDDGKERLELSFRRDGKWKALTGGRTQIYNKASIISLGDEGLHVTSGTSSELVNYLSDYETANKGRIPLVKSISRLGWLNGSAEFFPFAVNEDILFEEDKGTAVIYRNLAEHGDYEAWKAMMTRLRQNPVSRFITSASFASPLLYKIGVRTFVIHLWHMSASGKSAALKAAISVWGNPLRLMGNGFATVVGTEQLAGTLRNLPFGIDEKQSADERKLSLEHLIYVLGQGSGKIRGARGGGNAEVAVWHNIVMLTGEEPITRSSSLDGIQTRTFEIYGKPVDDMEFAKQVHIVSENNYGFAGAVFMRAVCAKLAADPACLRREYTAITEDLRGRGLRNVHADYVAAVALGDILAETIVFGTDAETARREALRCGEEVYALNEAQMSTDVVERAWDFIVGWLISNEHRFDAAASPFYGKSETSPSGQYDDYFVIPQYLDEALDDAGFNVKKTFQGLRDRGLISTQRDSDGYERTKSNARVFGKLVRSYHFRIKSDQVPPLGGKKDTEL
ncbi:DUF927 domain-containing protein [Eubacteriales bacterium OttesenSCG-928-A19]|nr:DUF927 domain-containing protein [Eubacteriales bacterium OttesenSCG-928-A19]